MTECTKDNRINIGENDISLVFEILEDGSVAFLHCQRTILMEKYMQGIQKDCLRLVEVQVAGENQDDHHGSKYTGTIPGKRLIFKEISDLRNKWGRKVEIHQEDPVTKLLVTSHFQFMGTTNVIESWTSVTNQGAEDQVLTYVSSFALTGLTKSIDEPWDITAIIKVPHNTWYGEFQWKEYTLPELGLTKYSSGSTKRLSFSSTGTWNSHEYLPMGYVGNDLTKEGWYFSIIHNGSWHWEVSDIRDSLYLQVSGPTEAENHWSEKLRPSETFTSVPVAVALTNADFDDAVKEMTWYHRLRRRKNKDNENLPVIFNDFMNCLNGDPTEEKEYPLIDAASEAGCEYYTIDAGWYADGSWWSMVGEWEPSKVRFPHGLNKIFSYIKKKGMVPGIWLELEVMGVNCPIAAKKPDDWFFCRHGKRVIDHGRYQLDYRNPKVRAYANKVIQRLVVEYGVGYIKMDYNINAGIGTELSAYSVGAGLLSHNRAYLAWLDKIFHKYPNLIIENCGSGGMRINDALLSRHSIQSSSDQTDYMKYPSIVGLAPTVIPPEQIAVWSYPLVDSSNEATVFNMVNAMMMRIHLSGPLASISAENFALVKEGITCYKAYRKSIKDAYPFWPIGFPKFDDIWVCMGLRTEDGAFLAIWNRGMGEILSFEFNEFTIDTVEPIYPLSLVNRYEYFSSWKRLMFTHLTDSARIYWLKEKKINTEE